MLLFWRKRRHGIRGGNANQTNANRANESTHDGRKTLILLIVLHIYIAICAYAFQKIEYVEAKTAMPNLKTIAANISRQFNFSAQESMSLIRTIINAANEDKMIYMRDFWGSFSKAFWFVTILFTTVGTGHIVPVTFGGRLLAIITALIGIPLYALFLKHFGECILFANKKMLSICSCKRGQSTARQEACKNTKIVLVAFFEMMIIIFTGALGAFPFDWTYFEGIYFCFISLSTVGFGDLIPDLSGDKAFYGVIYMFYNVIGLSFVSCFICSVVNAIDDFNAVREAVQWAARSLNPSNRKASSALREVKGFEGDPTQLEKNGIYPSKDGSISLTNVRLPVNGYNNKGSYLQENNNV